MLFKHAVTPKLLEHLGSIMKNPVFNNFDLVGGTSLALQIGHRMSVDIDLFGDSEINENEITNELKQLGKTQIIKRSKSILIYSVDGVKIDFVNYRFPVLKNSTNIDSIRLASFEDIGAMKLNAISGRGSRKDFIDLYFLLNYFSLKEILKFYNQKYEQGSEFLVLKSLAYFNDAELEAMPKMISDISWNEVKVKIMAETIKLL